MALSLFSYDRRTPLSVLAVEANMPLVTLGGNTLKELREDVFDAAFNTNLRAKVGGCDTYATALMGGEPFAVWR